MGPPARRPGGQGDEVIRVFFPFADSVVPVGTSNKIPEGYIDNPAGGVQVLQYLLHNGLGITVRVNEVQEFLWHQDTLRDAINSSPRRRNEPLMV